MRVNPFESQLEKLARTLTEQFGVQVICQGDNAWTDGDKIVLPSLPEPMEESLERMMVGYLDHEMGHVAFSDFKVAESFAKKHPGMEGLLNVIEDARIERDAMQRWPGVRRNLDMMFEQIRPLVRQLIQQRSQFDRFCTAIYLRLSHHNDMMGLKNDVAGYEDLFARFQHVQNTRDAARLAETILERWLKFNPQKNMSPSSEKGIGGASNDKKEAHKAPDQTESAGGPQAPASEQNDSCQERRDGQDPAGDRAAESPNDHGHKKHKKKNAGRKQAGGAPKGNTAEPKQSQAGANSVTIAGAGTGGQRANTLIDEALAEAIAGQVAAFDSSCQYRPFTTQHDRIKVVPNAEPAEVKSLLETGRDTVRRLRRGLTNALRSAEKRWWREDQTRGMLSPRRLYRLSMDLPRLDVFRTKATVQGKSTAVSILLDASGSMSRRKMNVAQSAMQVLLEALADLKIPTEALTFTTGNALDVTQLIQQTGLDVSQLRERYGRLSNLEIGLIKRFSEPVKVAMSRLPNLTGTGLTPLGEAIQVAASRLIVRSETRLILLVLTDGKAGCEGGTLSAAIHAQEMAGRITKAGIELIGVGILDENIREIIRDAMVIRQIEELPVQLCKLLSRTLMKGVCHVG